MGEAERYQEYKKLPKRFTLGQPGNALFALFAVNIVMFFLILLSRTFFLYTHQGIGTQAPIFDGLNGFAMPANLTALSEQPWTILTFMFSQGSFFTMPLLITMFSNMLWLWAFGYILQDLSGNKYIFPVYIYGSLLGAVFFIIFANAIPVLRQNNTAIYLFGAQIGTAAIAMAVATLAPNYKIFKNIGNGISVWILTALFILLNFVKVIGVNNAYLFAILGSVLAGYLFILLLHRGKDLSIWMINLYNWANNLFNPDKKNIATLTKQKTFYNTGNRQPFSKTAQITQQRVDEILDKISQQGYHFLSDEEKNILKRASQENL